MQGSERMTSKAERKRRSRARRAQQITLAGGEAVKAPAVPGQHKPKEDPMSVVTLARQRRTGIEDPRDARQPLCGTDMGLCIRALTTGDERAQLADAWAALSAAHRNYRTLIIGMTGDPQGAAIPMIPEPMETDPSLRVDLRTHDEKLAAAKASWAAWEAKIAALPFPQLRWAINGTLRGFLGDGTLWRDGKPTDTGRTVVAALRAMEK